MRVFYDELENCIQDFVSDNGRGRQSGEELEWCIVMTWHKAIERMESAAKSAPKRIMQARFDEMLEVLPPVQWTHNGTTQTESFKMSERIVGDVTTIFVRVGSKCYSLCDNIYTPHSVLVDMCNVGK